MGQGGGEKEGYPGNSMAWMIGSRQAVKDEGEGDRRVSTWPKTHHSWLQPEKSLGHSLQNLLLAIVVADGI